MSVQSLTSIPEKSSRTITTTLTDRNGDAIAPAQVSSLTLTLYLANGTIINSRDAQDILNANGGSLTDAGVLEIDLGPNDNAIVGTNVRGKEIHYGLIQVVTTAGDQENKEFYYTVEDLAKVT